MRLSFVIGVGDGKSETIGMIKKRAWLGCKQASELCVCVVADRVAQRAWTLPPTAQHDDSCLLPTKPPPSTPPVVLPCPLGAQEVCKINPTLIHNKAPVLVTLPSTPFQPTQTHSQRCGPWGGLSVLPRRGGKPILASSSVLKPTCFEPNQQHRKENVSESMKSKKQTRTGPIIPF